MKDRKRRPPTRKYFLKERMVNFEVVGNAKAEPCLQSGAEAVRMLRWLAYQGRHPDDLTESMWLTDNLTLEGCVVEVGLYDAHRMPREQQAV